VETIKYDCYQQVLFTQFMDAAGNRKWYIINELENILLCHSIQLQDDMGGRKITKNQREKRKLKTRKEQNAVSLLLHHTLGTETYACVTKAVPVCPVSNGCMCNSISS
jgi:hypothetical protein